MPNPQLSVLEICAGAGGQARGLELAGFAPAAAIELEPMYCQTLRRNRPAWEVVEADVRELDGRRFKGIDLLAGGLPCQPFSDLGRRFGSQDERDLFPAALRLIEEAQPRAVMLENVRGFAGLGFRGYREHVLAELYDLGYEPRWRVLDASAFGVPQMRLRFILLALRHQEALQFRFPSWQGPPPTVGQVLADLMAAGGWQGAGRWAERAHGLAPTITGGSKKGGGPHVMRSGAAWARLGVNGSGIADWPPEASSPADFRPKLTLRMLARIQGFSDEWEFAGGKTEVWRQIGNALPPPVAAAVGSAIRAAMTGHEA